MKGIGRTAVCLAVAWSGAAPAAAASHPPAAVDPCTLQHRPTAGAAARPPFLDPRAARAHGDTQIAQLKGHTVFVYTVADDGRVRSVKSLQLVGQPYKLLALRSGHLLTEEEAVKGDPRYDYLYEDQYRITNARTGHVVGCFSAGGTYDSESLYGVEHIDEVVLPSAEGFYYEEQDACVNDCDDLDSVFFGVYGLAFAAAPFRATGQKDLTPLPPGSPSFTGSMLADDGRTTYSVVHGTVTRRILSGPQQGQSTVAVTGLPPATWNSYALSPGDDRIAVTAPVSSTATTVAILPTRGGPAVVRRVPRSVEILGWRADGQALVVRETRTQRLSFLLPDGTSVAVHAKDSPLLATHSVVAGCPPEYDS